MIAQAIAPVGGTPFAGLLPWLGSLWRRLRASAARRAATPEEEQVLHLIDFVASRFGDPLLQAATVDDLDDCLDALAGSSDALYCTALLAQHVPLFQASEPISAASFAEAVGKSLGSAQGLRITQSQQILDAWLDAQQQVASLIVRDAPPTAERVFGFSLASPEIPAEVAELVFHGLRASFCSLAIVHVIAVDAPIEGWLARALTDRLIASATEHLRLLASIPGVTVDEAIIPASRRLDFAAIVARHAKARLASQRTLEATRVRLGL